MPRGRAGPHGNVRRALFPLYFLRLDFLWTRGRLSLVAPKKGATPATALSNVGISGGARAVYYGRHRAHAGFVSGEAGALRYRPGADSLRPRLLPPLAEGTAGRLGGSDSMQSSLVASRNPRTCSDSE